MGFISVEAGLTVAMIGAAILSFACAAVLFALGRRESHGSRRRHRTSLSAPVRG